jgi:hypothetical protein
MDASSYLSEQADMEKSDAAVKHYDHTMAVVGVISA